MNRRCEVGVVDEAVAVGVTYRCVSWQRYEPDRAEYRQRRTNLPHYTAGFWTLRVWLTLTQHHTG
ncbi:MAG: hypothetical protein ACE5I7_11335 [Candidatus Binatia bacterium]